MHCLLPTGGAAAGTAPHPQAQSPLPGLLAPEADCLVSLPGSSPDGPAPRGGGVGEDREDAEGAVEPPEASALEVPMEPPEPRSPEQVGPRGRPAEPPPSARRALVGTARAWGRRSPGLPALWSLCARAVGVSASWPPPHTLPFPAAAFTAPSLSRAAAALEGWTGAQGQHPEWHWSPELTLEARGQAGKSGRACQV